MFSSVVTPGSLNYGHHTATIACADEKHTASYFYVHKPDLFQTHKHTQCFSFNYCPPEVRGESRWQRHRLSKHGKKKKKDKTRQRSGCYTGLCTVSNFCTSTEEIPEKTSAYNSPFHLDRKSVGEGKSVDHGGRRILKKKNTTHTYSQKHCIHDASQ